MDFTAIYLGLHEVVQHMGDPLLVPARDHVDSALLFVWINLSSSERDFVTKKMNAAGISLE